jgi:hypothetical protein
MKLISHRGNINGKFPLLENRPEYIDKALLKGYDVEIDIRVIENKIFLGHDEPQYEIDLDFLLKRKNHLWCHCKNLESMSLALNGLHCFSHDKDDYVFTSKGIAWAYPGKSINKNTIAVLPETTDLEITNYNCLGICSDFVENYLRFS